MYPASADFHNAVKNGNPQMPLLIFPGIANAEKSYSAGSFIYNTWVNTSNVVYEANDAKTCIVPATEGEIFTLTADVSASSTYVYLIAFLDDSNTVLKRSVATSGNTLTVIAVQNATKCLAGFYNYDTSGITMLKLKNYGKSGASSPSVFTAEDIDVNAGIEFDDLFNTEENISIGQALMNNIRFTIFNDGQLLNDYEFGEFIATIGVRIARNTYTQEGIISVTSGANNTYVATTESPYLTRNGEELEVPPAGKLANILIYNGTVYCVQTDGRLFMYDDATGAMTPNIGENIFDISIAEWVSGQYINANGVPTSQSNIRYSNHMYPIKPSSRYYAHYTKKQNRAVSVAFYDKNGEFLVRTVLSASSATNEVKNASFTTRKDAAYFRISVGTTTTDIEITENIPRFMAAKFKRELRYGAYFANNILTLNQSGVQEIYEFVPLGTFLANRPDAPSVSQINMSCDDRMKKFDRNLPDDTTLGITYPTTIGNLYKNMCDYLDVPYETDTFINSTATIAKRPAQFESVTMRTVLQWIAEAAGSNAKFNRDGVLCLQWLNTTTAEFDEGDYSAFSPFWYETQQVDKLCNRNSQGGDDGIYGSGEGGYLILDNPLMKGAT